MGASGLHMLSGVHSAACCCRAKNKRDSGTLKRGAFITSTLPHALLLQGDDGPDVRGGSGDILLVHATETDRKGMAAPTVLDLCPAKGMT